MSASGGQEEWFKVTSEAAAAIGRGDLARAGAILDDTIRSASGAGADLLGAAGSHSQDQNWPYGKAPPGWSSGQGVAPALALRAQVAIERGRFAMAVTMCTAALQLESGYVPALNNRGVALACMGEVAAAVQDFEDAGALLPSGDAALPLANLGAVNIVMGDAEAARKTLADALQRASEATERLRRARKAARAAKTKVQATVRFARGARGGANAAVSPPPAGAASADASALPSEAVQGPGAPASGEAARGNDRSEGAAGGGGGPPAQEAGDAAVVDGAAAVGGAASAPPGTPTLATSEALRRYEGPERGALAKRDTLGTAVGLSLATGQFALAAALCGDPKRAKEAWARAGKEEPADPVWLAWVKALLDLCEGGDAVAAAERPIARARRLLAHADGVSLVALPARNLGAAGILATALGLRASALLAAGRVHEAAADAEEARRVAPRGTPSARKAALLCGGAAEAMAILWLRGDRRSLRTSRARLERDAAAFAERAAQHARDVAAAERKVEEATEESAAGHTAAAEGGVEGGAGAAGGPEEQRKKARRARRKSVSALRKLTAKAPTFHLLAAGAGERGGRDGGRPATEGGAAALCALALPERVSLCDDDLGAAPAAGSDGASGPGGATAQAATDVAHARALCELALARYGEAAGAGRAPSASALLGRARMLQQLGRLREALSSLRAVVRCARAVVCDRPAAPTGEGASAAGPRSQAIAAYVPATVRAGGGAQDVIAAVNDLLVQSEGGTGAGEGPQGAGGEWSDDAEALRSLWAALPGDESATSAVRAFYATVHDTAGRQADELAAQLGVWAPVVAALDEGIPAPAAGDGSATAPAEGACGALPLVVAPEKEGEEGGGSAPDQPAAAADLLVRLQSRAAGLMALGALIPAIEDAERARFLAAQLGQGEPADLRQLRGTLYCALSRKDGPH